MGLDASVMCACFREGKAKPPPFPEHVKLDDEGYLNLDLPYKGNEDKYEIFEKWLEHACEHSEMELISEYISDWGSYRLFQQALGESGWEHYPTLKAELPEANGGLTSPAAAARMLEELEFFNQQGNIGWRTALVDSETGDELYEYIVAYGGTFILTGTLNIGLDERGVFIHQKIVDQVFELFRSVRLEQRLLQPKLTDTNRSGEVEYIDLDSGQSFRCKSAIPGQVIPWPDGRMQNEKGQIRNAYPSQMHVEKRQRNSSEYEYILTPLRKICEASVEADNPIRWS